MYHKPSLRFGLQLYVPLFILKFEYFEIEYWDLFVICLFVIWNFLTFFPYKAPRHPDIPTINNTEPQNQNNVPLPAQK